MKQSIGQTVRKIHEIISERQQVHFLYSQTSFSDYYNSFEFVQQLFPTWVVFLCSIRNQSVQYISENCVNVFGYTAQKMRTMTLEDFIAHIHPDDQEPVTRITQYIFQWMKEIPYDKYDQYRFITNHRHRHANGQYFHLYDEQIALLNKNGQQLFLTLYKNIPEEKPFSQVKLEIFRLEKGSYKVIEEYVPSLLQQVITRREREILRLIQSGQSNKEIAGRLYISEHTARNHRSNLFEKAKARNVIELLNNAKAMQWI